MITIEQIKNIAKDIKEDKEWVNDSHTFAEHKGVVNGLDRLLRHLQEIEVDPSFNELTWWRTYGEYVSKAHSIVDAEASGYADGDGDIIIDDIEKFL